MVIEDAAVYRFGPFCYEPAERRLSRNEELLTLTPKCADVLWLLIQQRGHLVEKRHLMQRVWSDSTVEESNLTVAIATLRKILNDSRDLGQYIETVSKLGYRFTHEVEVSDGMGARSTSIERWRVPSGNNQANICIACYQEIPSVAVLPLIDESEFPDDYLADGITESIINALSQLIQLRVVARSSVFRLKHKDTNPRQAGLTLGVQSVVAGKVVKKKDHVVINVDLVDVASGCQLWGGSYHRPLADFLEVQEEISQEIVEKLRIKLRLIEKARLIKRYTTSSEAYHAYLKGRYCLNKRETKHFWKAIEFFRLAIRLDQNYALAYVGLADCYSMMNSYGELPSKDSIVHMKTAAEKALALDSDLAEAHASIGHFTLLYNWDIARAADFLRTSIALKPNYVQSHHWYAHCLMIMSQFDQAMSELKIAAILDPLSLVSINTSIAAHLIFARKYDEAIDQCRRTIELEQGYYAVHAHLGFAYSQKGMLSQAIMSTQESLSLVEDLEVLSLLGYLYALSGKRNEALKLVARLKRLSKHRYVDPSRIAMIYVGLKDYDPAFAWLERAYEARSPSLVILSIDPRTDTLCSDPRFTDLLRRVGLPDKVNTNGHSSDLRDG
jgi:TolB-like protein/DNA-binding winged helix-turn-helix (wHTH) protein